MSSRAQSVLPDIAASADSGGVTVSWNSQYSGLKSVSILRSADSINYTAIDKIKKPDQGPQSYYDQSPLAGKSYYKLLVIFSSGLNWKTNYCSVVVNKPGPGGMPKDTVRKQITKVSNPALPASVPQPVKAAMPVKTDLSAPGNNSNVKDTGLYTAPGKRYVLTRYSPDDLAPPISIKSEHIYTDPGTGHVDIYLPDDLALHHYSLKFYDDKSELATEIPNVPDRRVIIDKRNFQQKGIYHFVLRKDGLETEDGYIVIVPNP